MQTLQKRPAYSSVKNKEIKSNDTSKSKNCLSDKQAMETIICSGD
jgi:hypothetical protein